MHEMRAAKEDAERVLGGVVMMYDQVRPDGRGAAGWVAGVLLGGPAIKECLLCTWAHARVSACRSGQVRGDWHKKLKDRRKEVGAGLLAGGLQRGATCMKQPRPACWPPLLCCFN